MTSDHVVRTVPVVAVDGAASELLLFAPSASPRAALYWLPAMGVPARHYLPLAQALAARGIAVALHEWRGIGSSDRRAGWRQDWGYRELLCADLPAGLEAAHAAWPQAACWLGGHSLGGQLATLFTGHNADQLAGLVLVASGAPYWRCFDRRGWVRAAYWLAPALAKLCGHLPGRRIGFGGNEARGVIADWARSGRTGRYTVEGMSGLEDAMARMGCPLLALRMRDDWLGPAASLDWLLAKWPRTQSTRVLLTPTELAGPADHFSWMKSPDAVATRIASWCAAQADATSPGS